MPRIALAGFSHETNTFSPIPTPYEAFSLAEGDGLEGMGGQRINSGFAGFCDVARREGYELVPLFAANATPSGLVTLDAFDRISGKICALLEEKGPFDGVYLRLHAAMVVEGFVDGETEFLKRIRRVVGNIPVVASLDLHGNITEESVALSSAMVAYRTYPHVDKFEAGQRCGEIMVHLLKGRPLFKAYRQLPFLIPISSMSTNLEPARTLYRQLDRIEEVSGMISVSFLEGFPPADIFHAGPSLFAYAEQQDLAREAVRDLYDEAMAREGAFVPQMSGVDEALDRALSLAKKAQGPVILADVQDNAGAGGTSDTPWLLEALVRHGVEKAAVGVVYDPGAAEIAHQAGEGRQVRIALGGKLMPGQAPFESLFTVEKLAHGEFPLTGPMGKGITANLGKMAQLRVGDVRVVVSSIRKQALDQSYFRRVGIEPSRMKILVLKSSNHYRADFEPISSAILQVAAPAAMMDDPAGIPYKNLRPGVRLGGSGPVYRGT